MTVQRGADIADAPEAPTMPLHEQLERLDAALADAAQRRSAANDARRARKRWQVGREVTRELTEYTDAVHFQKREPDEELHRELQRKVWVQIEEKGLLMQTNESGVIRLLDPAVEREGDEANAAFVAAQQERDAFVEENVEALEAERLVAESQDFREALAEGDAGRVKEILDARAAQPKSTLVSADL